MRESEYGVKPADYWIQKLDLSPHPEGGYFRESYRSSELISQEALPPRFNDSRHFSTCIYFLLAGDQVSHFHRICSDELWHFYAGAPLTIHLLDDSGYRSLPLDADGNFQQMVPSGAWFGASLDVSDSYALVGCTVSPGFDFADFEMAKREDLLKQWPEQADLIQRLTI